MSRRDFLVRSATGGALLASNFLGNRTSAATGRTTAPAAGSALAGQTGTAGARIELATGVARIPLVGMPYPPTDVWAFGGAVPGQPLRVRRGEPLSLRVANGLSVPTSVHWHGIRLPWAMDGVAGLTQAAIAPGESFDYDFTPPDAGTFWYHSHANTSEQVGRGLYGPLIVDEDEPIAVDRELVWMLDDWRLAPDASIVDDFGNSHDLSHGGRVGNTVTVNGHRNWPFRVRSGERLRLRLVNAANARQFALDFGDLPLQVIAIDGQPVRPHAPEGPVFVPSAGRVDLIIDLIAAPSTSFDVVDRFYREATKIATLALDASAPLRTEAPATPVDLGAPSIPEPDLADALVHEVVMSGGAMGGLREAILDGKRLDARALASQGRFWAINEVASSGYDIAPMLEVPRGRTVRMIFVNQSAFAHPMHLHGHHVKLVSIDGKPPPRHTFQDSVTIESQGRVEVAFVADNPGRWLLHCHVLEHQMAGLGAIVSVS